MQLRFGQEVQKMLWRYLMKSKYDPKYVHEFNDKAQVELCVFCVDCGVHKNGIEAIENFDEATIVFNQHVCDCCISGSEWVPRYGDKDNMPDLELIVKGNVLICEEGFKWDILDIVHKKCEPSMIKIECDDLTMSDYWIHVDELVYYDVEVSDG